MHLPFRIYSAYKSIQDIASPEMIDAFEIAIKHSINNMDIFKGKTAIFADISGSMNQTISNESEVTCSEIACLLISLSDYICEEALSFTLDTSLHVASMSQHNGIIANANLLNRPGGGANLTLGLKHLIANNIKVDRILLLSDNEINQEYEHTKFAITTCERFLTEYKKKINPDVWFHGIDLQGYGRQQFKGPNINIMAGWSDKVLDFIHTAEKSMNEGISD